mgnify:CR=1 FL=1
MNDLIIDTVFEEMTKGPNEPIKTQYEYLNDELSKCDKGSIITFSGTMCGRLFLNLIKQFAIDHKNCLYFKDDFYKKRFFMELITLNSDNNDFEKSKNEIKKWNITLSDSNINDLTELKRLLSTKKPDYIFIDNLKNFSLGNSSTNEILAEFKQLIYEYKAILFINLDNTDFVNDVVISKTLKYFSDVIIDIKHSADDVYSLLTLKSLNLDWGVFSLKYDYKHFKFEEIDLPDNI